MGNAVVIFDRVKGIPTAQIIALHQKVQSRLDAEAFKGFVRAKDALSVVKARSPEKAAQRGSVAVEGRSKIEDVVKGVIDRYVVLSDEAGDNAALAIEFGRDAYETNDPGQLKFTRETVDGKRIVPKANGAFVLHKAFKIAPGGLRGTGGGEDAVSNGLADDKRSVFKKERLE